jgi:Uncharacterized protein conserved in bacteria
MPEKNEQKNDLMTQSATIESTIVSSKDGTHRYMLTRRWDRLLPKLLVVMIRPGYSGLVTEDTSTSLVLGQAVELGFGSVAVANIFCRLGLGEKDLAGEDSTDKENDTQILKAAGDADKIVIATGRKNSAVIEKRRAEVLEFLRPHAAKLHEIADSDGRSGFHPLSPRIRFHWTLVSLSLDTQEKAKRRKQAEPEAHPKAKP